jgi:hypothetical protein
LHRPRRLSSLLLKALRSGDSPRALAAADRLRVLPHFANLTPERIAAWGPDIRRKHALAAIAAELGFASWDDLRATCEPNETRPFEIGSLFDRPSTAVFLNHWCRTWEEAASIQSEVGGFLFPYRTQFVVAPAGVLEAHGIDAHDPDWERIGRDWVRPRDRGAFDRLERALSAQSR